MNSYLKSGKCIIMDIVGQLRIGMTRQQVVTVLGKPDDVSVLTRKERQPSIYKYGEIELHFEPGDAGGLFLVYTEAKEKNCDRQGIVLLK